MANENRSKKPNNKKSEFREKIGSLSTRGTLTHRIDPEEQNKKREGDLVRREKMGARAYIRIWGSEIRGK